jgi:hypothetical protein
MLAYQKLRWKFMIIMETMWRRTKVCHSMNYCITFVYPGSYMLVCACICEREMCPWAISIVFW